ncbi:TetR family transcriptional regulator [Stanieria sp. NIES-3757]|nr:TetR family transcriptional regulator [Stanieria sp. NIES-3757]
MQDKIFKKYRSLKLQCTPERSSKLYSITPIGIGNSLIESLTSYISRLALAHCVYPGILMERVVSSVIDKKYSSADIHKLYSFTDAINGTGVMGLDIVNALEKLTFQNRLSLLTLTNLSELIPSRKLLHDYKLWCPQCYRNCHTRSEEIYEPLIWKLKTVAVCSIHNLPLQEFCPYCLKKNYHLAWKTRPGYCSQCGQWLGELKAYDQSLLAKEKDETLNWHLWVSKNLEELLIKNSSRDVTWSKNTISQSLMRYAQQNAEGNIAALARQLEMPKNTVWLWCKGKNQPTLEMLLRICYGLKVSVWNFLTQENLIESEKVHLIASPPELKSKAKSKVLELDKIKEYLEQVIKKETIPPPSMEQVARDLQFQRRTISRHFPELCRVISANYTKHRKATHRQAIESSCQEVREAVKQLHSEGKYPSHNKVEKLISRPGLLRYEEVKKAFTKAKQELNFK